MKKITDEKKVERRVANFLQSDWWQRLKQWCCTAQVKMGSMGEDPGDPTFKKGGLYKTARLEFGVKDACE